MLKMPVEVATAKGENLVDLKADGWDKESKRRVEEFISRSKKVEIRVIGIKNKSSGNKCVDWRCRRRAIEVEVSKVIRRRENQ
jgi:hypothetical protein